MDRNQIVNHGRNAGKFIKDLTDGELEQIKKNKKFKEERPQFYKNVCDELNSRKPAPVEAKVEEKKEESKPSKKGKKK